MGKHCLGAVQSSKYQDRDNANNKRMCRKKYENYSAILVLYNNANAALNNVHKHIILKTISQRYVCPFPISSR